MESELHHPTSGAAGRDEGEGSKVSEFNRDGRDVRPLPNRSGSGVGDSFEGNEGGLGRALGKGDYRRIRPTSRVRAYETLGAGAAGRTLRLRVESIDPDRDEHQRDNHRENPKPFSRHLHVIPLFCTRSSRSAEPSTRALLIAAPAKEDATPLDGDCLVAV